ncbi:putative nicotinamide-nucleotide adenylyltransferase [Ostertagia ostertagi]
MEVDKKMLIGLHLGNGYGSQAGAWRMRGVDPQSYTSFDARVKQAQAAERGKFQFIFLPDGPGAVITDIATESPAFNLDVMMTLAAVARETEYIGLVATGSTTFNEPFNLARQFKALDVMSHGRAGWNAITSSGEDVAANYGRKIPSSHDRYGRAHEVIQLIQSLWGSWGKNAWVHDQESGKFANKDQILPINLQGKFVGSRGPLYIPPSEQGQPIIFHAGGSPNAHELAGRFANVKIVVIGPESTGKSTLCEGLARALNTLWIPEHARQYLLDLNRDYTEDDLLRIAMGQLRDEEEALKKANRYLVCDTDLYVLKVWAESRYGRCHRTILENIATRPYDLYLLTYIDINWEADPLREHGLPQERHYFYSQYRDIVINSGVPWIDIRGPHEQRLKNALHAVHKLDPAI